MSLIPTMNTVLTGLIGFSVKPIFPVEQYITPERILCAKKTGLKVPDIKFYLSGVTKRLVH